MSTLEENTEKKHLTEEEWEDDLFDEQLEEKMKETASTTDRSVSRENAQSPIPRSESLRPIGPTRSRTGIAAAIGRPGLFHDDIQIKAETLSPAFVSTSKCFFLLLGLFAFVTAFSLILLHYRASTIVLNIQRADDFAETLSAHISALNQTLAVNTQRLDDVSIFIGLSTHTLSTDLFHMNQTLDRVLLYLNLTRF